MPTPQRTPDLAMGEAVERYERTRQKNPIDRGTFHPVIMKMNASRRGERGMVSMDFILSRIKMRKRVLHSGIEL